MDVILGVIIGLVLRFFGKEAEGLARDTTREAVRRAAARLPGDLARECEGEWLAELASVEHRPAKAAWYAAGLSIASRRMRRGLAARPSLARRASDRAAALPSHWSTLARSKPLGLAARRWVGLLSAAAVLMLGPPVALSVLGNAVGVERDWLTIGVVVSGLNLLLSILVAGLPELIRRRRTDKSA